MRTNKPKRFRAVKNASYFFISSMFSDVYEDGDKPRNSHTVDDATHKVAESYGFNGRFEPISHIDAKDTVLSRCLIAITKPDHDALILVSNNSVEKMRHDKECGSINNYSYKVKNRIGRVNAERGRF